MDRISLYIRLICVVSILSGVLISLIPGGRFKNSFRSFCGLLMISAMVVPLSAITSDGIADFRLDKVYNSDVDYQGEEKQMFTDMLELSVEEKLKKENLIADISIEVAENYDATVIKSVTVEGDFNDDEKNYITDMLGNFFPEAEIIFKEHING